MPVAAHTREALVERADDRYQIVRRLGSGGFADVFEALDMESGEPVALKVVRGDRGLTPRVLREVEAARALAHPGIVALRDTCELGGHACLVWELVDGASLAELGARLGDADAVAAAAELFEALGWAHAQGVVHRDVKPQNVMLDRRGHVKVMDFGIARLVDADTLTGEGDLIGTVAYMSPEQARGSRVGPPSDVYSAGMVLYELLAGDNPLRGATTAETLGNVAAGRLPGLAEYRPDLPAALRDLVDEACAPRPGDRPAAVDVADALRDVLESGSLGRRRLGLARELVRPLGRTAEVAERGGGAALSALTTGWLLTQLPAYPASWTLPLVALSTAVWAVAPQAGLAWVLGVLAFPMFNVSAGAGLAWVGLSVAVFVLCRTRPVMALWPALALLLTPVSLTLVAPVAAAVLGRRRGPLTAAWAGAVTLVVLRLVAAPRGTFTGFLPHGRLAAEATTADSFAGAAASVAAVAASPAALLQMALWAGLAAAADFAVRRRSTEARLWVWAGSMAAAFAVYAISPALLWDARVTATPLLLGVALPAAVILLPLVLWPVPTPRDDEDDGHPEIV